MKKLDWQIETPIDAVIFDCDSTLSYVEGITELAKMHHVYDAVHALTEEAMARTGINLELYRQRLELVKPTRKEMEEVADIYWDQRTEDTHELITLLQELGKEVYVLSAGIQESVELFVRRMNIPSENVFAVPVYFDEGGEYKDFDRSCPLASMTGKSKIVEKLKQKHSRLVLVGDGMNDIEASRKVDRFIGYGGSCYRPGIAELSPFYLRCKSMSPVLPLILANQEVGLLPVTGSKLLERGLLLIEEQQVEFRKI